MAKYREYRKQVVLQHLAAGVSDCRNSPTPLLALQDFLKRLVRTMDVTEAELYIIERRIKKQITMKNSNNNHNSGIAPANP